MAPQIPTIALPSGEELPALAYGTGTAWFKDGDSPPDRRVVDAIKTAIDVGYRHFDGAQMYNTETELGLALAECNLPRSEVFITTKAASLSNIEESLEKSLRKLGLEFVDLYLIHQPFDASSQLGSAWRAMEDCQRRGLARNIGVSNFGISHVAAVLEVASVKPCVNQIELHPYLQQRDLLNYLRDKDIRAFGFAPLTPLTKLSPGQAHSIFDRLAVKYLVQHSAILLRWVLDQEAGVITTSGRRDRLEGYIDETTAFKLDAAEVEEIYSACVDQQHRGFFKEEFEALERANGIW